MSSLAQQLKKIGTADATKGFEKASKHRASFLFDSKQAADYDIDTIYSIGVNGITELKQLDSNFTAFEKTLFSESMKGVDRVLQTKEDNAKLDESITLFLRQLSPYFLLKPSGKALEWLIRRFRIHEFNIDAILHAILPYHETALFVTMVSILQIDEAGRWAFLRPIRKSKQPLERTVLIQNMIKDRSLVEFVCETVLQAVNRRTSFKTLASFYVAAMLQYIATLPVITDEVLTAVFPYVLEGLKAKGTPDYQIASYMIISQISERAAFTYDVLSSVFTTMTTSSSNTFQMLLCLVHICQTQETFVEFPDRAFKNLCKMQDIETVILTLLRKYSAQRFLQPFLIALAKHSSERENFSRILNRILQEERLPSAAVYGVCSAILDRYLEEHGLDNATEMDEYTHSILQVLHHNYSKDLDAALQRKLEESKEEKHTKTHSHLYSFISKAFSGTRHQPLKESNTTLFLSVNHVEASIRLVAVKKLNEILNEKSSELARVDNSDTFVRDTLIARLQDDDERVVLEVLSMEGLTRFVAPEDLLKGLVHVITAFNTTRGTRRHCLVYLLTVFLNNNKALKDQVLSVVLGHLLLVKDFHKASIALISKISTSELKHEPLLKNVSSLAKDLVKEEASPSADAMVTVDIALINTLAANMTSHHNLSHGLEIYLQGLKSDNAAFRLLSIFVITKAIHQLGSEQQIKVVDIYLPALLRVLKSHSATTKALRAEAHDGLPTKELLAQIATKSWTSSTEVSAIHFSLLSISSDLKKPAKSNTAWLSNEPLSEYATILLTMYKAFVGTVLMSPYEQMIEKLFELHLTSDSIEFLCNLWTNPSVSALVQLRSLQIASANLEAFVAQTTSDAIDFQVVIPTLLMALSSPVKAMRETAVACLKSITTLYPMVNSSGKKGKSVAAHIFKVESFYGETSSQIELLIPEQALSFLTELLKSREEFITDGSYLAKYLSETLNPVASDAKAIAATKDAVVSFLLSHSLAITRTSSRVHLLELLDGINSPTKLKMLLPLIESLVQSTFVGQNAVDVNTELARYLVRCFSPETSSLLEGKTAKYRSALLQLLKLDNTASTNTDTEESSSSFRRLALGQINSQFFSGLSIALQRDIFVILIDLATNAPQETVRVVKQVLREIPINSDLVIYELAAIQSSLIQEAIVDEENNAKRQRKAPVDPSTPGVIVDALHRLVTVLELLEYKEVSDANNLVTPLFELLSTIMNADLNNTPVSIEYINQLMLSSLTTFVRESGLGGNGAKLDEGILRVDLVVNCIRATGNPQTHNQALLLMAAIATLCPEKVLHNIMPVFTFMGANVLRQDDNYSFHVIQQTLEKIIPPLVAAHRRQSAESQSLIFQVRPVIKVFVDALFHIPKHRRLRLFSVLITTLGEEDFLHAVTCLIIEKYTERASKGHQTEADSLSEFALALSNQFSAVVQMKSVIALLDVIQGLPNEKLAEGDDVDMEEHLFDLSTHNSKQIRQFKLSVLTFSANVMMAKPFLSKILTQTSTDSSAEAVLESYYRQLAERLLTLVGNFTAFVNVLVSRKEPSAIVIKFWRGIVKVTYDVLDKVHILLSLPSFVKIMVALFEHKDVTLRRKAMVLFNQKISNVPGGPAAVPAIYQDMVVGVSENLAKAVEVDHIEGATAEEVAINKQTALLCLSTIVRQFGASHPAEIAKLVPVIIGPSGLQHPNEQVKASCLVCLTFMCQELGVRVVPFLPKFMPVVLSILGGTLTSTNASAAAAAEADAKKSSRYNNSVLLQLAVVSHLETLIKVLPQFVSPYVTKILASTLHPVLAGYEGSDSSKLQILEKNKTLLTEMAVHIQPRILLPPVLGYYETAVKDGKDSLLALFDLVAQTIVAMPRDVIAVHYKQIFKFFLSAFDYRLASKSTLSSSNVAAVEDAVIAAFMKLVMKLNETLFKPLFLKTLDWATTELQVAKAPFKDVQDRAVFFYKLLNALLENLKSIVTPYYGYVVDNVIEALTGYAKKGKSSASYEDADEDEVRGKDGVAKARAMDELWPWMVSSLQKCLLYDNDGLWNADRFEKLLHPLVNQLLVTASEEVTEPGTQWQSYDNRMNTWLVPCLGQLAVTLSNDALWKPLNYQVLLKTREADKNIRLSALRVVQEFYKRLGEEFLILLPETIPFLAELMEDDDHEVEALTQQVIADIEVYLGGSLQKYFR
ncbi:HEAT repeat-containing protein 1 [Dissophora globulifera]|uniref:U3 small nucleolar RNA-associated protein 10 n=1 Tax=Dissophora globulifera TaxID=979702 RepID=A0A9P6UY98_9FUNG|nr:HEAT repeat-containing protein 1 [Dissophora globulifera]